MAAWSIAPAAKDMPRKGYHFTAEQAAAITAARLASTARSAAERWAALTPDERLAELAERSARRREASRRGWRTRRANLGLPPGAREPVTQIGLYRRDVELLRQLAPYPRDALRLLLRERGMM